MTYLELLNHANSQLCNNKISVAEYMEMVKPLEQEIPDSSSEDYFLGKVKYKFEGDELVRLTDISECEAKGIYKVEPVITKEVFIRCYKEWVKNEYD